MFLSDRPIVKTITLRFTLESQGFSKDHHKMKKKKETHIFVLTVEYFII